MADSYFYITNLYEQHYIGLWNMEKSKLNNAHPQELEKRRIAEIKALSYVQRLERLMAILELSYMMKNAGKSSGKE